MMSWNHSPSSWTVWATEHSSDQAAGAKRVHELQARDVKGRTFQVGAPLGTLQHAGHSMSPSLISVV